jgi:hypothetical protein
MIHYAVQAWRAGQHKAATSLWALAVAVGGVFGAWPVGLWMRHPKGLGLDSPIWAVPNTPEPLYAELGDQRWFIEYHYRGLNLLGGNMFVLTGIGLFALLLILAVRAARRPTALVAVAGPPAASQAAHNQAEPTKAGLKKAGEQDRSPALPELGGPHV